MSLPFAVLTAVVVAPAPASAQVVGAPIHVGEVSQYPQGVAVDPVTGMVFAALPGTGSVQVISEASQSLATSIGVGGEPAALAADPVSGTVYVAELPAQVQVITENPSDPADDQVTATVTVPPGTAGFDGPDGIAVLPGSAPDTGTVYVSNGAGDTVSVISEATHEVTTVIQIPALGGSGDSYPFGITADPTTGLVYVADQGDGYISVISGSTLLGSFPLQSTDPGDIDPTAVASDPNTGTVYVTAPAPSPTYTPAVVYVIQEDPADPPDATVAASVQLPPFGDSGTPYGVPESIGVNPNAGSVYVSVYEGSLDVIGENANPADDTVNDVIALDPGNQDFDLVYAMAVDTSTGNPYSGTVYVDSNQTQDLYPVAFPPPLQSQTITFTGPGSGTVGGSAPLTATASSGLPVTLSVDPSSGTGVCSLSGDTVSYAAAGSCVIDANQAGNSSYSAAPQVTQTITVARAAQSISFTAPATGTVGQSATLTATGGASGNPVTFSVDPSTASGICSVSGTNGRTVNYLASGSCIVDANQAGNANYAQAPQVTQTITVSPVQAQTISFTAPAAGYVGGSATLTATASSGLPVTFSVDSSSGVGVCTVSGDTVSYTAVGSCVIDANQAGSPSYQAAPQVTQTITIGAGLAVTSGVPPYGTAGAAFSFPFTAGGGTGPYVWSVAGGSLPPGLGLSAAGVLAGTPTLGGTYKFTVAVTDSEDPAVTVTQAVTVQILLAAGGTLPGGFTGEPYSQQLAAAGGVPPYSFAPDGEGDQVVPGLYLSSAGVVSGTPDQAGTFSFFVIVDDSQSPPAGDIASFTITIGAGPQSISFVAPAMGPVGGTATLTATGGGSGNPVIFSVDPSSGAGVCNVSGTNGTTVSYTAAGSCVIDANQAGNANYLAAPQVTATITVYSPIAFTSAAAATFTGGTSGLFTVTATGSPTPQTITEAGPLPAGVTFINDGGGMATLAGTPAASAGGTYMVTLTATNGVAPAATQAFVLTVTQAPAITSASSAMVSTGTPLLFTVSTTGTPTATLTRTGALPPGVTFTAGTNGTATLSGIPTAAAQGVYPITFTAKNAAGTSSQGFTLTVDAPPAFTSSAAVTETAGYGFSYLVATTGYPTPGLRAGNLPSGVTFTDNGNGTGTLSGTAAAGTYAITVTAAGAADALTQTITLTVKTVGLSESVPVFTSAAPASATAGVATSITVTTAGSPTSYTTNVTHAGALPAGLTFTNNGNGTATISGTPTAASGGSYPITLTAKNTAGTVTQAFVLMVTAAPAITTAAGATATVGAGFSFTVAATGSPAPAMTETGALPQGLTWTDNGNGTATLAGVPAAGQGGVYTLTLAATNSLGSAPQTFTLTVDQVPVITSATSASGTHGQAFTFTFTATGYPVPSLTHSGSVGGLTFASTAGTGVATLSGTPKTPGTYTLVITAKNAIGTASEEFTLTVS